jgi:hypothetical protein
MCRKAIAARAGLSTIAPAAQLVFSAITASGEAA